MVVARLHSVFVVAGVAPLPIFALLVAKMSYTIFMFATTLPFMLTFLLLAKACITAMLSIERQRRIATSALVAPAAPRHRTPTTQGHRSHVPNATCHTSP